MVYIYHYKLLKFDEIELDPRTNFEPLNFRDVDLLVTIERSMHSPPARAQMIYKEVVAFKMKT
jgi:hypothetical protein